MNTDTLLFKDKLIRDEDLELTFHKYDRWNDNDDPKPVITFTLKNCQNLDQIDFTSVDHYDDGVEIEIKQLDNLYVFETTDMGNIKTTILCDKIEKEESAYSSDDYIHFLKEFTKQKEEIDQRLTGLNKRIDSLKQFLHHEHDIINRKIEQANWLAANKKHFLEGRQDIIKTILDRLNEKTD